MDILIYTPSVANVSTRREVLINTLHHVIWRIKSLMFKHHMKEITTMQKTKHLMIQILRLLIFQTHHCNINRAVIKIICLREIYLSLTKKQYVYCKKNLFLLPSGQERKSFIDEISKPMNEWIHESPLKDIAFKEVMVMRSLLLQKPSRKSN